MALWILSRTTRVSRYQNKHSPTHTYHDHQSSLICFSICYDPWHPPCSIYVPDTLFPQSPKFSCLNLFHPVLGLAPSTSYSIHFFSQGEIWGRLVAVLTLHNTQCSELWSLLAIVMQWVQDNWCLHDVSECKHKHTSTLRTMTNTTINVCHWWLVHSITAVLQSNTTVLHRWCDILSTSIMKLVHRQLWQMEPLFHQLYWLQGIEC